MWLNVVAIREEIVYAWIRNVVFLAWTVSFKDETNQFGKLDSTKKVLHLAFAAVQ